MTACLERFNKTTSRDHQVLAIVVRGLVLTVGHYLDTDNLQNMSRFGNFAKVLR